jgi:serine/threonine protein kinase
LVLGESIGVGQFGEVFRAKLQGKEVAVKRLFPKAIDEQTLQEVCESVCESM